MRGLKQFNCTEPVTQQAVHENTGLSLAKIEGVSDADHKMGLVRDGPKEQQKRYLKDTSLFCDILTV